MYISENIDRRLRKKVDRPKLSRAQCLREDGPGPRVGWKSGDGVVAKEMQGGARPFSSKETRPLLPVNIHEGKKENPPRCGQGEERRVENN